MSDTEYLPVDQVKDWLTMWAAWARGNQLIRGSRHVLAEMMRRAAGETPGRDTARPDRFTPAIHAVDKALAQMRLEAQLYQRTASRYRQLQESRRMIVGRYLGARTVKELASRYNVSEGHVSARIQYGERYLSQKIPEVYDQLTANGER